jgi:hypothetical protein
MAVYFPFWVIVYKKQNCTIFYDSELIIILGKERTSLGIQTQPHTG